VVAPLAAASIKQQVAVLHARDVLAVVEDVAFGPEATIEG
jgi:hypothetical protein